MPGLTPLTHDPFFLPGSPTHACLLLHGLGGGIYQLRWLGEYLHQQGLTVQGINFPGHGIPVVEMPPSTWPEWYSHSLAAYKALRQQYAHVSIVGFSTGCVVALHLSAHLPPHRLALLSPFMFIKKFWFTLFPLENYVNTLGQWIPSVPRRGLAIGDPDIKALGEQLDKTRTFNLTSVRSALALIQQVQGSLPHITVPTLIVQSSQDSVVDPSGAQFLSDHLGTDPRDKTLHWLGHSDHIISMDRQRQQVFEWVGVFLQR